MPTAKPIMTTIICTKKMSSNAWPMSATAANATTMATPACPGGSSVATTPPPKSSSRTSSATGMPNRSPCSRSWAAS